MKHFLKPTLLKIILFIIFFVILYFLWSLYLSFTDITMCPLELPGGPTDPQQPATFLGVLQQIPIVIMRAYNPCGSLSQNFFVAQSIVSYASLILPIICAYILACGVVFLIARSSQKKPQKK